MNATQIDRTVMVIGAGLFAVALAIAVHAQVTLDVPPEDRRAWVAMEHHLTINVPAPVAYEDRPAMVVIERRPYTAGDTELWTEVLRVPVDAAQTLPWELAVDVYVTEPGGYEYRAYAIGDKGEESANRNVAVSVACVPGPPNAPTIIEISKAAAADVNLDGLVNAIDVQLCVNAVLGV